MTKVIKKIEMITWMISSMFIYFLKTQEIKELMLFIKVDVMIYENRMFMLKAGMMKPW